MASRLRLAASGENPITYSKSGAGGEGGTERKPEEARRREVTDLGGGSEVVHVARFVAREAAWGWFDYLDKRIPWTRPTIRVFGRSAVQEIGIMIVTAADPDPKKSESAEIESCMIAVLPRDTCYVADEGLTDLRYSGHQPHAHSWDEFPVLKDILNAVHEALPGSHFNSLLLNRYKTGSDYVSWHADDEPLYGPTPEIASVTFGCEREFLLRKKLTKSQASPGSGEVAPKRLKVSAPQQHSFLLKHGSLLVMRGYTQRDWQHSVPKRAKASSPRINLTFRRVL